MEKKRKHRTLRRIGRICIVLLLLFAAVILFIRSPWGQDIIVDKAVDYVSGKTGTKVEIERLFVTFAGGVQLEGLYLEDTQGDTLIYSKTLEADVALSPILFGNSLNLKNLEWKEVTATVKRPEGSEKFNFDFLIDAFATTDSPTTTEASEPMAISIGTIDLSDVKLRYTDSFLGMDANVRLGRLNLEADQIDLETMRFELDAFELSDSEIGYTQTKPFVSEDTTATTLPYLSVDDLKITAVKANYNSVPDKVSAEVDITDFLLELPKADLTKNDFEIDLLQLKNSHVSVVMAEPEAQSTDSTLVTKTAFEWPQFLVEVRAIDLQDNAIAYRMGDTEPVSGTFNPKALALSNVTLQANELVYRPEYTELTLDHLGFAEKSGFQLRKLAFDAQLEAKSASISDLELLTNNSKAYGGLALEYTSVNRFIDQPEETQVNFNLVNLVVALEDAYPFQPDLASNEYVIKAAEKPFTGGMNANGTLADIEVSFFDLDWGDQTSLKADGRVKNILDTEALFFDFNNVKAVTNRKDLLQFVSEADLGISIPQDIVMEATAKGSQNAMNVNASLKIPEGFAMLTGNYSKYEKIAFEGNLKVDSLRLDKLLQNDELGPVSFVIDASGSGADLNSLNASLQSNFTQLQFKGYDFSNLVLDGEIVSGVGDINLKFKDSNLNLNAKTRVNLDTLNSKINLDLHLIGADLYALGITEEEIKAGLKMKADFTGNNEDFTVNALVSEGVAVYDNEQYQLGDIEMETNIGKTTTDFTINSDFLNGTLVSNTSPDKLNAALQRQFKGYFPDARVNEVITDSVRLQLDMALTPVPVLTEVFLRGVQRLDSINVQADFDAISKVVNAKLYMPSAMYNGVAVDSLNVLVEGNATDLNFQAGLAGVTADPINVKRTFFTGNLQNNELLLDFSSFDDQNELVHIASEMTLAQDTVKLHINPSKLIFNEKEWTVPQDNRITFSNNHWGLRNMVLNRNDQELTISNQVAGIDQEHIGVTFDNFKLQTFLSLFNPDKALAAGLVEGRFVVENPFDAPGIIADFKINSLEVMQNALGNLSLDAVSKGDDTYDFNLALKDGGADLDLTGDYTAADTGARLNLDLDLNKLEIMLIQGLSEGLLKDAKGYISGNVDVQGTTAEPKYDGRLDFNQVEFNVASLNSIFKIDKESLQVDNTGLYLDTFQIGDANSNTFTLDGNISTEKLTNPGFDLQLKARQFQVLNSTKEDNELFYGTASFDADVTVKGNLNLPKVDGKLRVRKITDVTYVIPESQLDVEERDGVVIFVNRENPDAILTRNEEEETASLFRGIDAEAILEIADDAIFHIVIDEKTGDNLQVSGDAALNLNIEPNGRINLSGRYELSSGHYETSLYNLVKRKFEINPSSTITWQGDPTDAKLDVTAVYKVETSAAPLMSAVTSGEDLSVIGKYRQVLPFIVYLNVDGELLEPKLSFGLDMPEDEQGSLGGAVYGRVQQLNGQESALNKQVFSLLALNRFFPASGSDGSSGGTAALARGNVNKVLSGQLNAFSDKIFGKSGFELDFDLDSFTDYQGDSPQDRTQLNINAKKKLFDDRLIVTAGSAVDVEGSGQPGQGETPIIGNVSLEYLMTENGRYRLKGFRKNEYTNVIDGQLILTGVALIFQREFNRFSELFSPTEELKDQEKKEKENNPKEKKQED
ncbi:translocation/assembly module TamB [Aggregatimonas sangjinii]|uniref:Translocation/assembly module TamB n=1 Tax=Aggregatimonas sangjinii TaxID=2583587 RepID=A0A5B7SU14_9FLAO|nr:translocation/assembly module TamB [Aggregatimonas sangjinii]QCX02037.1 translocation/assembly module TamB [Aggregatimonas sangjinii]